MKKLLLLTLIFVSTISATAATLFPNRTDFRDEQIYFVIFIGTSFSLPEKLISEIALAISGPA